MGDEESGRELIAPLLELGPELSTMATMPAAGLVRLHNDPEGNTPGDRRRRHHREPPRRGHRGLRRGRRPGLRLALHLGRAAPARRCPRPPGAVCRRCLPPRGRLPALLGRAALHARDGAGAGGAPRRGRRRPSRPGAQSRTTSTSPSAQSTARRSTRARTTTACARSASASTRPSCSARTSASSPPASTGRTTNNTPPVRSRTGGVSCFPAEIGCRSRARHWALRAVRRRSGTRPPGPDRHVAAGQMALRRVCHLALRSPPSSGRDEPPLARRSATAGGRAHRALARVPRHCSRRRGGRVRLDLDRRSPALPRGWAAGARPVGCLDA